MQKFVITLVLAIVQCGAALAAQPGDSARAPATASPRARFLSVKDGRFIDTYGRQVILHGINLVNKSQASGYIGDETLQDFALMADWGFNCLRLGIIWDGLEPEPGKFNEEYLRKIDGQIRWAKRSGLYVFLDMHQDLFSVKYNAGDVIISDGAPAWATLDENQPHTTTGEVWSDAYFTSSAVQKAFDNFWANAPTPDGVGVQDHYARAWAYVARRYANDPAVIGYDLMNEPFEGTPGARMQVAVIAKLAEALAARAGATTSSPEALRQRWGTAEGRREFMQALRDMDLFRQMLDVAEPGSQEFERNKLAPMYRLVSRVIRGVDLNHILFLEPSISTTRGVRSALEAVVGSEGKPDRLQAYAPHAYDMVTDTPDVAAANNERVELIFTRHGETAKRLGLPMLVGEWGSYNNSADAYPAARFVASQFEKLRCSDTHWDYTKDLAKAAFLAAIARPYPMEISGTLVSYSADFDNPKFTCVWKENPAVSAPTRIYLPKPFLSSRHRIKLLPRGIGYKFEFSGRAGNQYMIIPPTGKAVDRRLSIYPKVREGKEK